MRIDPEWQPKADVAAWTGFEGPYPTATVNLECIEAMLLPNRRHIPIDSLWSELDRQVKKSRKASSSRQ